MSDGEGDVPSTSCGPDWVKIHHKLANLPTLEKLLAEANPNEHTEEELQAAAACVKHIVESNPQTEKDIQQAQRAMQRRTKQVFKKSVLLAGYKYLLRQEQSSTAPLSVGAVGDMEDVVAQKEHNSSADRSSRVSWRCAVLEQFLVSKAPRSQSGVLVVTVFTSPYPEGQKFSCQWNCYYCPNEPGQPRSYLLNEPGVRRANRLDFDPCRQFEDRVRSLIAIGHPADKVELLVLGGTWESYPLSYRETFIRDLFYAANVFFDPLDGARRPPLDLLQEQLLNEYAKCKIIGVTLETRPDTIAPAMLVELRRFGCTRVQLGVQHTDDGILTLVNRQATRDDTIQAIKLLKDSCFKVDIHLMPDLPGATPELDKAMFDDVLGSPYLQADQWKIYPCQTTPFTVIEEWHKAGKYIPYGLEKLVEVLLYAKTRVHPWIRLNRVIRDIPVDYVLAGVEVANLRQLLGVKLQEQGQRCRCIRCREVKGDKEVAAKLQRASLVERRYEASEGTEIFISMETPAEEGEVIFGFLRLRLHIRNLDCPFPELEGCALIRELHVYGNLMTTYDADGQRPASAAQHSGVGRQLLERAEAIAKAEGYERIAVISGVGVRGYYKRWGYRLEAPQRGAFLIKSLREDDLAPAVEEQGRASTDEELVQRLSREGLVSPDFLSQRSQRPSSAELPPLGAAGTALRWMERLKRHAVEGWEAFKRRRLEQ